MRARNTAHVQFGAFELDVRTLDFQKRGHRLKLGPQPVKVLALLASRPGQLVTREELQQAVWGNETFIDFEQGLNFCIRQLRAALDDDAEAPRYIETVPRRGYRFIAKVQAAASTENDGGQTSVEPAEKIEVSPPPIVVVDLPAKQYKGAKRWLSLVVLTTSCLMFLIGLYILLAERLGSADQPPRSLAVLPLLNLSGDPEQEYFADGMTDELITELAQLRDLRVISHTSVRQYKGSSKPLPQIADQLKVDAILEGTVLPSGDHVRITAQLIRVRNEKHLWAKSYEGNLGDALALQEQIARDIAAEIKLTLTASQQASLTNARSVSPAAHEAYLRGRYWWHQRGTQAELKGLQYFEEAVKLDPKYAPGWSGIADAYVTLGAHGGMPPKDAMPRAKAASLNAIELDPLLAEAHTSLAAVKMAYDWDCAAAEKEYMRAIELNPNYATAHHWYSHCLVIMGRFPEAIREIQQAHDLDPYSMTINYFWGMALYFSRDYAGALAQYREMADLDANARSAASNGLLQIYEQQGDYAHALEAWRDTLGTPGNTEDATALANAFAREGPAGYWKKRIELAQKERSTPALDMAKLYARQGNRNAALESLERAYQERSAWFNFIGHEPAFDSLRFHPRFKKLAHEGGAA